MFSARLIAFEPAGDRIKNGLLDSVSWDCSLPLNDVSALSLSYPTIADTAGLLDRPIEVAVQVSKGNGWVEPKNGRFLSSEIQADQAAALDVPTFTFRGLGSLLERPFILRKADNPGKPYDSDNKRNFLSATAGQIVLSTVTESRAKYSKMLAGVNFGFTASNDSLGNAWNRLDSVAFEPGTDLLKILGDMTARGLVDWWMQGRELMMVNADSAATIRGSQLNLGDVTESPLRATYEGMATRVALEGAEGRYWGKAVPGAQVPYGDKVIRAASDAISTEGTAKDLLDRNAAQATGPRREYTRSLAVVDLAPLLDYELGDWVQAKSGGAWESVRIFELGLTSEASSPAITARVTLNDRFVDASVRDAKRLKGIVHGTTQNLGSGGVPSRADRAIPAAPTGVAANSLGYWADAVPLASVDVSWQAVTANVDGLALNGVEYYEARCGGQTKRATSTKVGFDGLQPSRIYDVTVRAISTTGIIGRWSATASVLTAYPLPNLDQPTPPILKSENGALSVEWDGKLEPASGSPYTPPRHFSHVLVEVQKVGSTAWTKYARDHGTVLVGLSAGDQWRVRLYAVDMLGNESAAGGTSTITISSQAQQALKEAQAAADSAGKAQTTADGSNARMSGTSTSGPAQRPNGTPLIQGDEYVRYKGSVASGNASEVLVWNGKTWTKSYFLASQILVLSTNGTIELGEGVVKAPQIYAGAVDADKIKAGALDAFQITSPKIQSVTTANRGIKWVGNTLIGYTSSGTEAFRLDGTRATITAGILQTVTTANRGIKLDASYLRAWDANGTETFRITASTGAVTMKGSLTSGSTITGATIEGGVIRTASSGARMWLGLSDKYPAFNTYGPNGKLRMLYGFSSVGEPGLWMYDDAGQVRLRLVSTGYLDMLDSAGTRSLRVLSGATKGGHSAAGLVGPSYGGARTSQTFYTKDVGGGTRVGIQLNVETDSGTIREGDAFLIIENGQRWQLGTKTAQIASTVSQRVDIWAPGGLYYYGAPTSTAAANAIIATTPAGRFYRSTSLRKHKHDISDAPDTPSLLDLRIRTWVDKGQAIDRAYIVERNANREAAGQLDQLETVPHLKRISGVIAEEVWELTGREELLTWDETENLQGVPYERLGLEYSHEILQWARGEIAHLQSQIDQLEEEHNGTENA